MSLGRTENASSAELGDLVSYFRSEVDRISNRKTIITDHCTVDVEIDGSDIFFGITVKGVDIRLMSQSGWFSFSSYEFVSTLNAFHDEMVLSPPKEYSNPYLIDFNSREIYIHDQTDGTNQYALNFHRKRGRITGITYAIGQDRNPQHIGFSSTKNRIVEFSTDGKLWSHQIDCGNVAEPDLEFSDLE